MKDQRVLAVLSVCAALLMIGVGMTVAVLPRRVHEASGSLEAVGLIASVLAGTYLLAQMPIGVLADRFGAKPFLVAGYCLCGVAGLVLLTSESVAGILLGRAVQGIGEAPVWALGPAVLSVVAAGSRGRAIGIYNAAIHAGLTVGPGLGLLVTAVWGASGPFAVFAGCCFLGAAIILRFLPHTGGTMREPSTVGPSPRLLVTLLGRRQPLVLLLGILLYGACYGVFLTILPIAEITQKAFSGDLLNIHFIVFYASISTAQLAIGPLTDRYGRGPFMVGGLILAGVGLFGFLAVPSYWALLPIAVASLGLGVFCVASLTQLHESVPASLKGTVSGAYYLAWGTGYMLGPLVVGRLETMADGIGFGVLAAVLLCEAAAIRWARP